MVLDAGGLHTATSTSASSPLLMEDFNPSLTPGERELVARLRAAFCDLPQVESVLEAYIADKAHPMGIVSFLKNPETREIVIKSLQEMATRPPVSREDFQATVRSGHLASNDAEFCLQGCQRKDHLLRAHLLEKDPVLYSTTSAPTPEQEKRLEAHARHLRNDVLEDLRADLLDVVSGLPASDGFPAVAARAKTADGIIDKIKRMRSGNNGKEPRPKYCLADVPDVVGGRITLSNPDHLDAVMKRIEEKYGREHISQKDNFYTNPDKKFRPYRCITYTVQVDGVPCEIQVTTLRSSLTADLVHNTAYKQLHPELPQDIIQYTLDLQQTVTAGEHEQLGKTASGAKIPSMLPQPTLRDPEGSTMPTTEDLWLVAGASGTPAANDPRWHSA